MKFLAFWFGKPRKLKDRIQNKASKLIYKLFQPVEDQGFKAIRMPLRSNSQPTAHLSKKSNKPMYHKPPKNNEKIK
jgi:hypothetical protein